MRPRAISGIGRLGVNTDADPFSIDDQECVKMQNAINNPLGVLTNRPPFTSFNGLAAAGAVVGGVGVPLANLSRSGTRFFFIGRGPIPID